MAEVKRATRDDEPFADASPLQLEALGMNGSDQQTQEKALQKLRKKQVLNFKEQYNDTVGQRISTNEAVEFMENAYEQLDKAFTRGYNRKVYEMSANAQQLDWNEWAEQSGSYTEARVSTSMTGDVVGAGLAVDTSLARMISRWSIRSEAFEVDRAMDARNRGTSDLPEKAFEGVALPISFIDYEISERVIQNSMNFGEAIDDAAAEEAGEALAVGQENLMAYGWDMNVPVKGLGSFSVDGYLNTDYSLSVTAPGSWDTASNVTETMRKTMQKLHGQTADENRGADVQGGAWVYYPRAHWSNVMLADDPQNDSGMSVADRINQAFPWLSLRQSGVLDPNEMIMVVQDRKFIDIADALTESNMSWDVHGGLSTHFKTMNCRIPRIKGTFGPDAETTGDAIVGVAHVTGIQ